MINTNFNLIIIVKKESKQVIKTFFKKKDDVGMTIPKCEKESRDDNTIPYTFITPIYRTLQ